MEYKPRKLRSYKKGIIRPHKIDDSLLYTYTRPLTITEFLVNSTPGVKKKTLEEMIDVYFSDDSFIRKEPVEVASLSCGIKNFNELEGANIFDVFKSYDIITKTEQIYKKTEQIYKKTEQSYEKSDVWEELVEILNPEFLFFKGGDCKTRAIFFTNLLRHHKFPCRIVKGYKKKDSGGHVWMEINYDGLWTSFEPYAGINLISNKMAVEYYSEYSIKLTFSKP